MGYLSPNHRLVDLAYSFFRPPHAYPAQLPGHRRVREHVYCEAKRARLVSTEVLRWLKQQKVSGEGSKVPAELLHPQPFPTHPTLSSFFPHRDRWSIPSLPRVFLIDGIRYQQTYQHIKIFLYRGNDFARTNRNGVIGTNGFQARLDRLRSQLAGPNSSVSRWSLTAAYWTKMDWERRQTTRGLLQPSFALPHVWQQLCPPLQSLPVREVLWMDNLTEFWFRKEIMS